MYTKRLWKQENIAASVKVSIVLFKYFSSFKESFRNMIPLITVHTSYIWVVAKLKLKFDYHLPSQTVVNLYFCLRICYVLFVFYTCILIVMLFGEYKQLCMSNWWWWFVDAAIIYMILYIGLIPSLQLLDLDYTIYITM